MKGAYCLEFYSEQILFYTACLGGIGHFAMLTSMNGFWIMLITKNLNLQHLSQKYHLLKSTKEYRIKTGEKFKPGTHRFLVYPSTDWATRKVIK